MAKKRTPTKATTAKKARGGASTASTRKKPTRKAAASDKAPAKKPATRKRSKQAGTAQTKKTRITEKAPTAAEKKAAKQLAERLAVTTRILEHYTTPGETGRCRTIASCCGEEGVEERTFRQWTYDHPEISDLYKGAKRKHSKLFKDGLRERAANSLERLVEGYEYTEQRTEAQQLTDRRGKPVLGPDGKPIVVVTKTVQTKKHVAPHPTAVIFAIKNADPDEFSDKIGIEHSGEVDTAPQAFKIGDQLFRF